MVILDICLDNFYSFRNFHMNLTYPKKIVGSSIIDEHLSGRPNFRYKKVNIIMGSNASGKTTLGRVLMRILNFMYRKNYERLTSTIGEPDREASFRLDMATPAKGSQETFFYRIACTIPPRREEGYGPEDIRLSVRRETIRPGDSYESCVRRIEGEAYVPEESYLSELEKMGKLDWLFVYPEDSGRTLRFPNTDKEPRFQAILENILKALDPSIERVERSQDVDDAYVVRLRGRALILQNGEQFTTELLSSGTKAGVEVARVLSALVHRRDTFYYCDEKFSYIHSDIERAVLALMIDAIPPDSQLFFTTHNTDILDMNLPKHAFTFLRKDMGEPDRPITCVEASSLLKRSTDSLKNAVENDLFSAAPAVDLIYDIAERCGWGDGDGV